MPDCPTCCTPPESVTNINSYAASWGNIQQEVVTLTAGLTGELTETPAADAAVLLFVNGVLQRQGTDYTISGADITMSDVVPADWPVYAAYPKQES